MSTFDFEVEVVDDHLLGPGGVGEAHVPELDVAEEGVIRDLLATGSSNRRMPVDVLKDPRPGRHAYGLDHWFRDSNSRSS